MHGGCEKPSRLCLAGQPAARFEYVKKPTNNSSLLLPGALSQGRNVCSSLGIWLCLVGWFKAPGPSSNAPPVFFTFFCLREGKMYD